MEFEVQIDQAAVRRERRRTILSLIGFALVPVASFLRIPLAALMGQDSADRSAQAVCIIGFVGFMAYPVWRVRDSHFYRCPQCRHRLLKVAPQGEYEPNIHYACEDCRVIWDLGWGWHSGGEGGGG